MPKISCIGSMNVDKLLTLKHQAILGSSNPATKKVELGGVVLNIAFNLNDLGNRINITSVVGNDHEGRFMLDKLKEKRIRVTEVIVSLQYPTAQYTAFHTSDGELFIATFDGEIYDHIQERQLDRAITVMNQSSAWVFDCSFTDSVHNYLLARRSDHIDIFLTVCSIPMAHKVKPLLHVARALFGNAQEIKEIAQLDNLPAAMQKIEALGTQYIFATDGSNGVYVMHKGNIQHYPALALPEAIVSVNGAGDAFASGVIDAMLQNKSIDSCVAQGLLCAVTKITGGSIADLETKFETTARKKTRLNP